MRSVAEPGHQLEAFVHLGALPDTALLLSRKGPESVTYVSGMTCNPLVGKLSVAILGYSQPIQVVRKHNDVAT